MHYCLYYCMRCGQNMLGHPQGQVAIILKWIKWLVLLHILQKRVYNADTKIIIVFAYLLIYLLVVNFRGAIIIAWRESFRSITKPYFLCEASGHVPGKCSREFLENYSFGISIVNFLYYIMNAMTPVVHLIFVINCRVLRQRMEQLKITKLLKSLSSSSSQWY